MNKKVLGIILALVMVPAMLFAVPVVVTWEWSLDDPAVTTFRYQIGGEEADKWIVVDASQTSYTVEGLDGTQSYSLYLQQSYDGEHFSSSAIATAEPLEVAAETTPEVVPAAETTVAAVTTAPAAETKPAATETAPVVPAEPVKTEAAPVAETKPVEVAKPVEEVKPAEAAKPAETAKVAAAPAPAPKKAAVKGTNNTFNWMLGLYGNADYRLTKTTAASSHSLNVGLGLDAAFNNIFSFGKVSGIGVSARVGVEPYNNTSWKQVFTSDFWSNWVYQMSADMTIDYDIAFGPKSGMKIGAGAFLLYPFNGGNNKISWGLVGDLGFDFGLGKKAYLSLDANYRYYLTEAYKNAMTLGLNVGVGFKF